MHLHDAGGDGKTSNGYVYGTNDGLVICTYVGSDLFALCAPQRYLIILVNNMPDEKGSIYTHNYV